MKNIYINISAELHNAIKVYCAKNNITITQYLIALVKKDFDEKGV